MQEKILFIDRDGTLIHEPTDNFQVDHMNKLIFEPHVVIILRKFILLNFKLVMVTNQDGLYTKIFPYRAFIDPHKFMVDLFVSQGIYFEYILICPHFARDNCSCRKPKTELVYPWIQNKNLDKNNSYFIGDRITDIELAKKMGITGILYNQKSMNWNDIYNIITKNNRHFQSIRNTKETKIKMDIWLDKSGMNIIRTGIDFFDHMLEQIAIHSNILIHLSVNGDLLVDDHHVIEDTGIVLGKTILKCLGNKIGMNRFGFYVPMDESSSYCLIDLSGRPYLKFVSKFSRQFVGDLNTDMIEHFFRSLSYSMKSTIHLVSMGTNDHHKIESLFKAFGRALKQAVSISGNTLPTSKGIL
ncbi:bifunctional histidinol-phosphatase/imidazoleglycerol-phosphate dehydratase HisB [Buchnera aphidicola]|uniref:Imidazoleglycerol-phosphate dehydratase n=1 Tax=Buchnera aphidicola (Sarucallis kahawaluokalani) TaxID=1241878 RepID=A0A4D6YJI2_9GAMM|nr:bifunctional histidinol-phosphatase/imidazoleglycerol-phosphate dehydratase HisB [Buchnera aphidicola]QCI25878.1 bifunctional histidinol-phosphatase/imidazoleglycerol-phosphate dehydratase HisB [Buchnera aphidicola (Sarucallis kahawaluokalani)]